MFKFHILRSSPPSPLMLCLRSRLLTANFMHVVHKRVQREGVNMSRVFAFNLRPVSTGLYTVFAFKMASVVRRLYMVANMMEVM